MYFEAFEGFVGIVLTEPFDRVPALCQHLIVDRTILHLLSLDLEDGGVARVR